MDWKCCCGCWPSISWLTYSRLGGILSRGSISNRAESGWGPGPSIRWNFSLCSSCCHSGLLAGGQCVSWTLTSGLSSEKNSSRVLLMLVFLPPPRVKQRFCPSISMGEIYIFPPSLQMNRRFFLLISKGEPQELLPYLQVWNRDSFPSKCETQNPSPSLHVSNTDPYLRLWSRDTSFQTPSFKHRFFLLTSKCKTENPPPLLKVSNTDSFFLKPSVKHRIFLLYFIYQT